MVLKLVPDVLDKVFNYCSLGDLKNLSLTSSKYNALLQPWLLHTIRVYPSSLPQEPNKKTRKQLEKRFSNENIRVLRLRYALNTRIPEYVFRMVGKMSNLLVLDLTKTMCVDDANLKVLCTGDMDQLIHLNLTFTGVSDEGFRNIGKLNSLEKLLCCHCNITNKSLEHIALLNQLKKLDLSNCFQLTEITAICNLPTLEELHLVYTSITDDGISSIGKLSSLEVLMVSSCYNLRDAGMLHISKLPRLKVLDGSVCSRLTDEACRYIGTLGALETLSLKHCQFTDEGATHLLALCNLKSLNLFDCPNVSIGFKDATARLKGLSQLNGKGRNVEPSLTYLPNTFITNQ